MTKLFNARARVWARGCNKAATDWGIKAWNNWAAVRETTEESASRSPPTTPLLEMPAEDLCYWLGKFVLEMRKQDGKEYPPKSLYYLVTCFNFETIVTMSIPSIPPTLCWDHFALHLMLR